MTAFVATVGFERAVDTQMLKYMRVVLRGTCTRGEDGRRRAATSFRIRCSMRVMPCGLELAIRRLN
eukprot:351491-Heterocapsa_arctica.AAC.1